MHLNYQKVVLTAKIDIIVHEVKQKKLIKSENFHVNF